MDHGDSGPEGEDNNRFSRSRGMGAQREKYGLEAARSFEAREQGKQGGDLHSFRNVTEGTEGGEQHPLTRAPAWRSAAEKNLLRAQ
eukprot:118072-Pelagomonas_calceolata.AAC.1